MNYCEKIKQVVWQFGKKCNQKIHLEPDLKHLETQEDAVFLRKCGQDADAISGGYREKKQRRDLV